MARCTAPTRGHHTASGRAACPACGGSYSRYGYGGYNDNSGYRSNSYPSYSSSGSNSGGSSSKTRARWSGIGSKMLYTPAEVSALTRVRETVEKHTPLPDFRDFFLCHAWDDRKGAALQLHDLLVSHGVSVWFSEKDVSLGTSLLREIDKGLAKSKVGIVLVTPAFLRRVRAEGSISDKELSVLLARDQLVPIVHETTYDALREVSPMLGSRTGLSTSDNLMTDVAAKLAELVAVDDKSTLIRS